MTARSQTSDKAHSMIVFAVGEKPIFAIGDKIRVLTPSPIGHYRALVPSALARKMDEVEARWAQ
jgi:hypothetical protein